MEQEEIDIKLNILAGSMKEIFVVTHNDFKVQTSDLATDS